MWLRNFPLSAWRGTCQLVEDKGQRMLGNLMLKTLSLCCTGLRAVPLAGAAACSRQHAAALQRRRAGAAAGHHAARCHQVPAPAAWHATPSSGPPVSRR